MVGNFPGELADAVPVRAGRAIALTVVNTSDGLRTTVEITLPGAGDPVELWTITVENLSDTARPVRVVPYLEWVLNRPEADRGHTQYNRLFAEMEYVERAPRRPGLGQAREGDGPPRRRTSPPEGFLTVAGRFHRPRPGASGRRGCSRHWPSPRPEDTAAHPTFDPIGSLLLGMTVPARGSSRVRLLIGLAGDKEQAIDLIARHLADPGGADGLRRRGAGRRSTRSGTARSRPGRPQPYFEFSDDGRRLAGPHAVHAAAVRPHDVQRAWGTSSR